MLEGSAKIESIKGREQLQEEILSKAYWNFVQHNCVSSFDI